MFFVEILFLLMYLIYGKLLCDGISGATLGKGANRGIATLLGGALGVGAHRLASFSGDKVEPIFLGLSVFFIGKSGSPQI